MALAGICGIAEASYMKDASFTASDFADDVVRASQNFDNNYKLAVPPFENVRLWTLSITMQKFSDIKC